MNLKNNFFGEKNEKCVKSCFCKLSFSKSTVIQYWHGLTVHLNICTFTTTLVVIGGVSFTGRLKGRACVLQSVALRTAFKCPG